MPEIQIEKIFKSMGKVAIVVVIVMLLGTSFYTVNEQQQAVVTTFGKVTGTEGSGPHFKIPLVQQVHKVDTTTNGFYIGLNPETGETLSNESVMITSDMNFVNIDFYVEYKVSDPAQYLFASNAPYLILKNIAQGCIRTVVSGYNVDSVITTSKNEIQAEIKEMIIMKLEDQQIGLQLVNISIQDAEPPTETVIKAFKEVENAKQSMETVINAAKKYQNESILNAEAEADSIIKAAEAQKEARTKEATGQVARFNEMYKEYINFPEVTKSRMFYETMQDVLPSLKIIIDGTDKTDTLLPLGSFVGDRETNEEVVEEGGTEDAE